MIYYLNTCYLYTCCEVDLSSSLSEGPENGVPSGFSPLLFFDDMGVVGLRLLDEVDVLVSVSLKITDNRVVVVPHSSSNFASCSAVRSVWNAFSSSGTGATASALSVSCGTSSCNSTCISFVCVLSSPVVCVSLSCSSVAPAAGVFSWFFSRKSLSVEFSAPRQERCIL